MFANRLEKQWKKCIVEKCKRFTEQHTYVQTQGIVPVITA